MIGIEGVAPILDDWPGRVARGVLRQALTDLARRDVQVNGAAERFLLSGESDGVLRWWCHLADVDIRQVRDLATRVLAGERLVPEPGHRWRQASHRDGGEDGRGTRRGAEPKGGMPSVVHGAERERPLPPVVACRVCGGPVPMTPRGRRRVCSLACRKRLRQRLTVSIVQYRPRPSTEAASCPA
jgi:hypothetical protein